MRDRTWIDVLQLVPWFDANGKVRTGIGEYNLTFELTRVSNGTIPLALVIECNDFRARVFYPRMKRWVITSTGIVVHNKTKPNPLTRIQGVKITESKITYKDCLFVCSSYLSYIDDTDKDADPMLFDQFEDPVNRLDYLMRLDHD